MQRMWPVFLGLLLFTAAPATQAQSGDGYGYSINASNTNTITITEYTGTNTIVTIPNYINNLLVTAIGSKAFEYSSVTSVTVGTNVTNIGSGAFWECNDLTTIIIPNSVASIADHAFGFCTSLTNYLTSFTIPNSVTNIGDEAFYSCVSLTSIAIGNNATNIGDEAFAGCDSLTTITVSGSNPVYTSVAGVLFNQSQTILIQCPGGKAGSYTIPKSVTNIGDYSFAYSQNLTSVTIGTNVTTIDDYAFYFFNMPTSITIPNSVTSIGSYAFSHWYGLTNVTIGGGVTNIGDGAFAVCLGLTSVYFKANAPAIGASVFGSDSATLYYLPGTSGWQQFFSEVGLSGVLWFLPNPLILNPGPSFGLQTNQFGFTISWATNTSVVVEVCTNLATRSWVPLITNTLTGGSSHFSDPEWMNYPSRFYRLISP